MNRRPTVYETVALPLSYTGDARSANEPVKYGHHAGAASGKFERDAFYAAIGLNLLGSRKFEAQTGAKRPTTDHGTSNEGPDTPAQSSVVGAMMADGCQRRVPPESQH